MDKDMIRYIGRFDFSDPAGPEFSWSACSIIARFYGTEVSVRLKSQGVNYFLVVIDGEVAVNSIQAVDEGVYKLASGLREGEHTVELVKRTEFYLGTAQFLGFDFGDGHALPLPPSSGKRIEFIGDSITCGFGNEGSHQDIPYDPKYDNAYLSYASIASRKLNAECSLISYSGYGIIRDYEGNEANIVPVKYPLVTSSKNDEWDFSFWTPQIVVINLGTNDFSFGHIPERDRFVTAYIAFLKQIHGKYPDSHILCTIGSVIDGNALEYTREYVQDGVVNWLSREGNSWISFLEFQHQIEADGYGISWHPSIKTHEKMGYLLADTIRNKLNW